MNIRFLTRCSGNLILMCDWSPIILYCQNCLYISCFANTWLLLQMFPLVVITLLVYGHYLRHNNYFWLSLLYYPTTVSNLCHIIRPLFRMATTIYSTTSDYIWSLATIYISIFILKCIISHNRSYLALSFFSEESKLSKTSNVQHIRSHIDYALHFRGDISAVSLFLF
jgi:hypothetical protein